MSFNRFERKHSEGFYTESDVEKLFTMQSGECYFCGKRLGSIGEKFAFHIDHLLPIAKDGTNWPGNLALTCGFCNKRKHSASTNQLWAKLKKENGVLWVKNKVLRNRTNSPQKAKLTRLRKAERNKSLDLLCKEIEVAISRGLKNLNYAPPEYIDISVKHISYYLEIWFNNSCVTMPAPSQNQLSKWHLDEYDGLAQILIKLEHLAGYV